MIVQYCFRRKPHLSIWSRHCLIQLSSWTTPGQLVMVALFHFLSISHLYDQSRCCFIWFSSQTAPGRLVMVVQFHIQCRPCLYDQSCSCSIWFLPQQAPNPIGHNSSIFFSGVNHTYMIGHVVVLSGIHPKLHLVQQIMTIQYRFQRTTHLSDKSRRCPILFSSQTTPDQIVLDN